MDYENMAQSVRYRWNYMDTRYKIFFFHDFTEHKTLNKQIKSIKEKYLRRIERFLKNIEKPTLFFRYISNEVKNEEGKSTELQWIEENYGYINEVLQRYNTQNRIIYMGDENTRSNIIKVYNVKTNPDDIVSRSPIINNAELYSIVKQFKIPEQEKNIKRFENKQQKKNSLYTKIKGITMSICRNVCCKVYIHSKEYDIWGK